MSASRAAISLSSLLLFAASASGQPSPAKAPAAAAEADDVSVASPKNWVPEPELAAALLGSFVTTVGLGDLDGKGGTAAYIGKQQGGLYVSWVKARIVADAPQVHARAVLDRLRSESRDVIGNAGEVEEINYRELPNGPAIEARLVIRHKGNETITSSRTLIWLSPEKLLRVVRAECVFAESDTEKVTPMCRGALASLVADDLNDGKALPLGNVPKSASAPASEDSSTTSPDGSGKPGPTLTSPNPNSNVLYQSDAKPEKKKKRTWIFILGAVLVAFAFWSIFQSKSGSSDSGSKREADEEEE